MPKSKCAFADKYKARRKPTCGCGTCAEKWSIAKSQIKARANIRKTATAKEMLPKKVNSRSKGKRGELEFAHLLQERNLCARRGQQFAGGTDSPDVICGDFTDIHFEVKRVEAGNLYSWMHQAVRDAGEKKPVVAHRKNKQNWVAIVPMEFMLELLILREGTLI